MTTMVASGSQFPASAATQEKGSRNKRKFRADPPSPLPLVPCTECNANANKGFAGLNGWKMDCQSMEPFDSEGGVDGNLPSTQKHACCNSNGFCNFCKAQREHLNSFKCFAQLSGAKGVQSVNRELGFGYEEFSNGEQSHEERELEELQEADWSDITESQLEELLLSNLDTIYKSAIKKIASCGYSEDASLKAILKYGRCYGSKDTLSNILDNALAYLRNAHEMDSKDHFFEDLQQLEKYILAEMVCVLREVRPFFSNGDAMWCLLICDMNVTHACAMDEDALNNFNKDSLSGSSTVALSVQPNTEPMSSSLPPSVSTNMTVFHNTAAPSVSTSMPVFHNNVAHQAHPMLQTSHPPNSLMPFVTGVPTFPTQGFSLPGNMAPNDCRNDDTLGSRISDEVQSEMVRPCCRRVDLRSEHDLQTRVIASSDQFQGPSAFTARIGIESEPGPHVSEAVAEECVLSMAQPFQKAERIMTGTIQLEDKPKSNPANVKRDLGALLSPSVPSDKSDRADTSASSLLKMSPIEIDLHRGNKETSDTTCRTVSGSCISFSSSADVQQNCGNFSDPIQTDLLIGNPSQSVESELLMRDCRIDPEAVDDASSFAVAGAELSLSLSSGGNEGAEVVNGSTNMAEEAANSNYDTVSLDQFFGGSGSQDRKDEMLIKMFHRVRELETQLQEWTEWAQQKVMQAARRLSKDKAELKALRQEKEEAIRLKKEKQTLEESTMKKLSEMENALRKASGQVERANAAVRKLEAENAEVKQEMEAAKLSAAESLAACREASKREKKTLKKFQAWERQKAILQEELAAEKRKLALLQQQLVQAKERHLQIEVRWKQEEKAKEEAIMRAEGERRAKEEVEATAKRKEEALRQKAEMDSQQYRDDVQRLEREIAQLRLTTESSKLAAMRWGSDCTFTSCLSDTSSIQVLKQTNARLFSEIAELQDLSRRDVQRDRECVMCLNEEMSVVFLPCAHQVVCTKCNELHEKQGMKDCPSCRTPIQQRVCVYSANS